MDKEEKILELELKIIELTLKRNDNLLKLAIAILIGVLSFFITLDSIKSYFNETIKEWVRIIVSLPSPTDAMLLLLLIIIVPFVSALLTMVILRFIFKSQGQIYDDAIDQIEESIKRLRSEK